MKKLSTHINDLFVINNIIFDDDRGSFMEMWDEKLFKKEKLIASFSKDNISISHKNTLRGLHFQNKPYGQLKYVRVLKGKALDVAVDLRKKSKTFGQHLAIELSENNHTGLWIPSGFAHGFLSLEDNTIFSYKCTGEYVPIQEKTIKWDDPDIAIKWGVKNPIISEKDKKGMSFEKYKDSKQIHA